MEIDCEDVIKRLGEIKRVVSEIECIVAKLRQNGVDITGVVKIDGLAFTERLAMSKKQTRY